jgi:hypothetical protein
MATAPHYDFHPFAEIFPIIPADELDTLGKDIKQRGLQEPIVLFEGKVLDGRNRYIAAQKIGHKFTADNFKYLPAGVDPRAFVISANILRRHLNAEQKRELIARRSDFALAGAAMRTTKPNATQPSSTSAPVDCARSRWRITIAQSQST